LLLPLPLPLLLCHPPLLVLPLLLLPTAVAVLKEHCVPSSSASCFVI
jgi:hypothetical protein